MKLTAFLLSLAFTLAFVSAQEFEDEMEVLEPEAEFASESEAVEVEQEVEDETDVEEDPMEEIKAKEKETGIVDPINYPGRLISRKKCLSKDAAAGQPIEFEYSLWNVGNSDVLDIEVSDDAFTGEDFVNGEKVSFRVEKIAAGKSHKQTVTVIAKEEGELKLTPAKVTYKSATSSDNPELTQYTSEGATEGLIKLTSAAYYARHVAKHYFDWACFVFLALPSTLVPYVNASNIVKRYAGKAKSN